MKNLKLLFLGIIASLMITGCDPNDDDGLFICRDGEGPIVTKLINLPTITGIDLDITADVYLSYGTTQKVTLEGQDNVLDELEFNISNGVARVDFDRCIDNYSSLRIYIRTPEFREITMNGSGDVRTENTLVVQDLNIALNGSGDMDLDLGAADDVNVDITGSGKIKLEGTADDLNCRISGSGDLKAFNLIAQTADVRLTGSGDAEVTVENELKVSISGSGDVSYKGAPEITVSISGSGELIDAN